MTDHETDHELQAAQTTLLEMDAKLRSLAKETAKMKQMVELHQRLVSAKLPDWIDPGLLAAMVEAEGEQAARREADLLQGLSPEQAIAHVQQQATSRTDPR